ncbi:hypothetical protein LIER_22923 [Lithospermum erythrorhizon]|uniref:Reverse transcriptase n=1 Tax=Lithospermum erythrorhizon TaxID=34254 RepID=A0AAV3QZ03_LITER
MRSHQAQNKITSIRDGSGKLIEDPDGIKEVVIQFYKDLFTEPSCEDCDLSTVGNILDQRLKDDEVNMFGMPITAKEIERVMLHMKLEKAPGPNGFTTEFYKSSWNDVKETFIDAVKIFFATNNMHRKVNNTAITLIPKVQQHQTMKEFYTSIWLPFLQTG